MRALAFAAGLLCAASAAWSQDSRGPYVGVSVGQASYKHTCDAAPFGVSCDTKDTAARFFGGYQFKPSFAMEVGFHTLGTVVAHGPTGSENADVSAIDFTFVGSWAIGNRYSVIGRLGFYAGELKSNSSPGAGRRDWETANNTDITYGLGLSYALTDRADFRAEWQHYGHMNTGGTPDIDIHVLSLGALYRF